MPAQLHRTNVVIVGLGYVGLPLAVAMARHHRVIGFDIDRSRIAELRAGHDRTREVDGQALKTSALELSDDPTAIKGAEFYIVTVPTPVDEQNKPDLSAVISASETVGRALSKGAIVVFESTVWPGVTEEICAPVLARASGLRAGVDFELGYSPERINPGDREHRVETITKVVAAQKPEIAARLGALYGSVTSGGVFIARDIKTAEAAKVIENAQRDINIAFINEVSQIFHKLGIATHDVLAAARTKWNFLDFKPGLVGGHCIGVDPYYLAHRAVEIGHNPEIILAGRRLNDAMGAFIADSLADSLGQPAERSILVLGLTFKENVPDLRNTRVVDIVTRLNGRGYRVDVHDPLADPGEAARFYGITLVKSLDGLNGYACVLGAVAHRLYTTFESATFGRLVAPSGLVADLKGIWRNVALPPGMRRWEL
ncbi:MAG: nucleotide sugar dehydrogenase [Alphaproteobacteria bacterium]|nr:nucleotide sugar dehydrogenase [Alphaproteobacteria bacterium]